MSVMGLGGGGGVIDTAYVEILAKGDRFVQSWQREFDRGSRGVQGSARRTGDVVATEFDRGSRRAETSIKRLTDNSERHFSRTGHALRGMFLAAGSALAAAGIGHQLTQFIQGASGMNELANQVNVTFGKLSPALKQFGDTAATSVGQSRRAALDAVVQFGDLFRTTGSTSAEAEKMGIRYTKLAGDLASFKNVRPEEALEALRSGLIGEAEPLRRYGVLLSETRVQQEAFRETGKSSAKDLTEQEKVQARYTLILRDTKRASDDFTETGKELANAQRTSAALWQNLGDSIGKIFLPVAKEVFNVLNTQIFPVLQEFVDKHGPAMQKTLTDIVRNLDFSKVGAQLATTWEAATEGVHAFGSALHGEGVTSDGFVGIMEQLGVIVKSVTDSLREGAAASGDSAGKLGLLQSAGKGIGDTLSVANIVIGFLADHIGLLARNLPLLIAGFTAYKAAQAAANAASAAEVVLLPIKISASIAHTLAIRSLARAQLELAASTQGATAVQAEQVGVENISTFSVIRNVAAWVAQRVALVATRVATLAMSAAQAALNFVLSANPIGLVVIALAALAAGLIYAYKHSETFRKIVDGAFRAIAAAAQFMWNVVVKPVLQLLVQGFLTVASSIVHSAAVAFGWIPGIGPKLRSAAAKFDEFKNSVNTSLNRISDESVNVTGKPGLQFSPTFTQKDWLAARQRAGRMATGGRLPGYGGGDILPILAEPGEAIVDKERTRKFAHVLGWMGVPGFQRGGHLTVHANPNTAKMLNVVAGIDTAMHGVTGLVGDHIARVMTAGMRDFGLLTGGDGRGFGSGSWRRAILELQRERVPFSIISTLRPGARTHASGSVSFHALNRAVDLVGPNMMRIWQALTDTNPTELIYSRAPMYKSRRGWRPISQLDPITRADHYSHVHAAYRRGGRVRRTIADRGFELLPGLNVVLADNRTGRVEPLAPTSQQPPPTIIEPGAVQVVLNGPVDAATLPQVQTVIEDAFDEFKRVLRVGSFA